jgi:hypothetical protein
MPIQLSDQALLKTKAYINGQWVDADSGETVAVTNPANGEIIAEVAKCSTAETRRAIEAAAEAFGEWRQRTAKERAACLRKWFNLMMDAQEDLALIMTLEQGKPLAESRGEIAYGANYIEWFAEEAKRIYGDTIPQPSNDKRIVCIKQPVGVVACITPWNFPNAMLTRKIAPALAAGCTVVCKPANATPLSAYAFTNRSHRQGTDFQSDRAQTDLHRLHSGRQAIDGRVCANGQTDFDGTRRQRAVHRIRRRRPRCRGRGRVDQQVSQCGSDLCLRQSHPGAGRLLRRICGKTGRSR